MFVIYSLKPEEVFSTFKNPSRTGICKCATPLSDLIKMYQAGHQEDIVYMVVDAPAVHETNKTRSRTQILDMRSNGNLRGLIPIFDMPSTGLKANVPIKDQVRFYTNISSMTKKLIYELCKSIPYKIYQWFTVTEDMMVADKIVHEKIVAKIFEPIDINLNTSLTAFTSVISLEKRD